MESFLWNVLATVIGGCILTFLFFLIREKCFPLPDVNGMWHLKNITENSAYNPYKGMTLGYTVILWCDGNKVSGTTEKVYECSVNGEREFIGTNRCRGVVEGFIQKNYFSKDKIVLHIVEDGFGRESTYSYELDVYKKTNTLEGRFSTMVADQDGYTTWSREKF
ncbi:hypothetical protein [Photobacterium swingsii]|uniref:hypothetical protein n=1 Tax=Photobacterium swingsii TaxID=680026 RepID=UPI0040675ABC